MKENSKVLIFLLIVLAFAVFGGFYYYFVWPKLERQAQVTQSIESLQQETDILNRQIEQHQAQPDETVDLFTLRKKLPISRDVDTLLRSIEEISYIAETNIQTVTFNHYDELVLGADFDGEEEKDLEKEEEPEEGSSQAVEEEVLDEVWEEKIVTPGEIPKTNLNIENLPETLKYLSLQLTIQAKDEQQLLKFIKEIEGLERIIRIEQLQFNQLGEEGLAQKDADESIQASIQLTTFYFEEEAF